MAIAPDADNLSCHDGFIAIGTHSAVFLGDARALKWRSINTWTCRQGTVPPRRTNRRRPPTGSSPRAVASLHPSSRRGGDSAMTAEQASTELRSLVNDEDKKWFYACAMGAGCTTEDNNEISVAIRRRDTELRATVSEPREGL
jgi:hypothetical protein